MLRGRARTPECAAWSALKDKLIEEIDSCTSERDAELESARHRRIATRLAQLVGEGRLGEGPLPRGSLMRRVFPRSEGLEVEEHGPIGVNVSRLTEPVERWRTELQGELCRRLRTVLGAEDELDGEYSLLTRPWALFQCDSTERPWYCSPSSRKLLTFPSLCQHHCALDFDLSYGGIHPPEEVIGPSIEPVDCRTAVVAVLDHLGIDSTTTLTSLTDCGDVFVFTDSLVLGDDEADISGGVRQLRGRAVENPARAELIRRLRCRRHGWLELVRAALARPR